MYWTLNSTQNKSGTGWRTCAHGPFRMPNLVVHLVGEVSDHHRTKTSCRPVSLLYWIEYRKIVETILLETQTIVIHILCSSQVVHHEIRLTCGLCYGLNVQRCFLLEIAFRTEYSLFFIIWFQCFSITLHIPIFLQTIWTIPVLSNLKPSFSLEL